MKTFRLIGMALLAVVMCVNFTSCSDDDEPIKNDDGIITNQKQLMQIKMVEDDEIITWDFTYDSKDRLTSINHAEKYNGRTDRYITNYTWSNNVIKAEDGNSTRTYTLNNNLVKSISDTDDNDWSNATLTYNSSNQLIAVQNTYEGRISIDAYTWNNDRIVKQIYTENDSYYSEEDIYEYTYSGKTCKGYFPLYCPSDYDDIFYVHPELIGLRCSQLPDQIYNKDDDYEDIEKLTYTFDKDGYVESCTVVGTYKNLSNNTTGTEATIYTFTWE